MIRARQNEELIDLTNVSSNQISELKLINNFSCPYCGAPVILKQGSKRRPHFAHLTPCNYALHESESELHLRCKNMLAQWLEDCGAKEIQMEYRLPDGKRIADLFFKWSGKSYALEVQKSMMSPEVFKQRNQDYQRAEIEVVWIFIGDLTLLKRTYRLDRVMRLQKDKPFIHLNGKSKQVTFLRQIVWINQREIDATKEVFPLDKVTLQQLLAIPEEVPVRHIEEWIAFKKDFRCYKFANYQRKEYKLLRLCAPFLINLSLLPSVVGWPIEGEVYVKPLFIWQAYVVLCIMSEYEEQDVFTICDIRKKLKGSYRLKEGVHVAPGLKRYLDLLVYFGMLRKQFGYYEYVKRPRLFSQLEPYFIEDAQLGRLFSQQKN